MTTIKQKQKLNAELNLGLSLAKALGNLRHLAEECNKPEWKGSMTQGEAIMDSLHAIQVAVSSRQKLIDMENGKV